MKDRRTIQQISPADGWRAVYGYWDYDGGPETPVHVEVHPLACWALVNDDGGTYVIGVIAADAFTDFAEVPDREPDEVEGLQLYAGPGQYQDHDELVTLVYERMTARDALERSSAAIMAGTNGAQ